MTSYSPREIVSELDRYIVGQMEAKRAVAIAMRNRWRRRQLDESLRDEVQPKNILMIGPTGVGKTEIARRLARLEDAPFIKVEATKFTEVGYVGRDVEQIIRDLLDAAIILVREKRRKEVHARAGVKAEEELVKLLHEKEKKGELREEIRQKLRNKELDDVEVDVQLEESNLGCSGPHMPMFDIPGSSAQMGMLNVNDLMGRILGPKVYTHRMKVKEALVRLTQSESDKLLDQEKVVAEAMQTTQNMGIVFLDEVDKICGRGDRSSTDVSREGVQRDLLPLVEGTTVSTKHGPIKTNHILFIASGAFHIAKPSDLLAELQGRFPIRVELQPLTQEDFKRILTEPDASLTKQYGALLATEGIQLSFMPDGIEAIASLAAQMNAELVDIGARRLPTVIEKLLMDVSFTAPDRTTPDERSVVVDAAYVNQCFEGYVAKTDLSRFIL